MIQIWENLTYSDLASTTLEEVPGGFWTDFPKVDGRSVFIKPNLVIPPTEWEQASTTHFEVIRLIVDKIIEDGAKECIIGDCGFKDQWMKTVELSGLNKLECNLKAKLIGLQEKENYHKFTLHRCDQYCSLFGAKLSDIATSVEVFINIPKLKVHKLVKVTGAIKNMMGIMTQKGSMHPKGDAQILHKRLRDLYFLTRNMVHFVVSDGIVGSEYAETGGIPRYSGVLVSGIDPWEIDVSNAKLMGIRPQEVLYLELIRRDLGRSFDEIEVPQHLVQNYELPLGLRK